MTFFTPRSALVKLKKNYEHTDDKIGLLQKNRALLNNASAKDLISFIGDNLEMLGKLVSGLSFDELLSLSIKYTSGNLKRTFNFLQVLSKRYFSYDFQKFLLALLPSFSKEDKINIIQRYPVQLATEIGLVFGLQGETYEGTTSLHGYQIAIERYLELTSEILEFNLVHTQSEYFFYNPSMQHGDLQSIFAGWEEHGFSFHLIKDGENIHLIYVNRGQSHEKIRKDDSNVKVFTFPSAAPGSSQMTNLIQAVNTGEQDQIGQFLTEDLIPYLNSPIPSLMTNLIQTLKTEDRDKIGQFLTEDLAPYLNKDKQFNELLQKSPQKVGNCVSANTNNAWHFALAAKKMKQEGCSFAEAYEKTKPTYKQMRIDDRANAFSKLITNPALETYVEDALPQIMKKMANKDKEGRKTISYLIDRLFEYDKKTNGVVTLLNYLCQPIDNLEPSLRLHWMETCVHKLKEKGLYQEKENQQIEQSMQFLRLLSSYGSKKEIASHIKANPSLICLFSIQELLNHALSGEKTVLNHLSTEKVKYILKEFKSQLSASGAYLNKFIKGLSIETLKALVNDDELNNTPGFTAIMGQCREVLNNQLKKAETAPIDLYKQTLAGIIIKGARATNCKEKRDVASYLMRQLEHVDNVNQLIEMIYKVERVFSHVRNPFLSRNQGSSRTNSYKETLFDFLKLRESISNWSIDNNFQVTIHSAIEVIKDNPKQAFQCTTYKELVNEMHKEQSKNKSYDNAEERSLFIPR